MGNFDDIEEPQFTEEDFLNALAGKRISKTPKPRSPAARTNPGGKRIPHTTGYKGIKDLSARNFKPFLDAHDACMVLFYDSQVPKGQGREERDFSIKQMLQAASQNQRDFHAYAAVDCAVDIDLCYSANVKATPMFRLYSKGHEISTFRETSTLTADTLSMFVELTPVLEEPRRARYRQPPPQVLTGG